MFAGLITLAPAQDIAEPASQPARQPTNLLRNGDFEQADETGMLPADWTTQRPDNVRLIDFGDEFGAVVQMTGDKKLMSGYGVALLSETKIPIKPNTRYRCTGYTRSDGPRMKVFIRGYATVTRRVQGELKTFDDAVYTMRKDIDPSAQWQRFNLDFDITPAKVFSDHQHTVKYVRIKLWAYWPAGTCWFDDIRFEEVGPLPPSKVRQADTVTHTGEKPRLGKSAQTPDDAEPFDEEQTWLDAANAFRADDYTKALPLAEQLVAHTPHKGTYRILLARTLAKLKRWSEAERQAAWFLIEQDEKPAQSRPAREIEPWQRDWALVVRAEACWRTEQTNEAKRLLQRILKKEASPHARHAAEELLHRIEGAKK
ncbi:MAG: tetratricopeptide repeat protein [Phycisphaerae bacterium]|nr:tetratricopeptide repeat protein [Phycisphaerae bacterium]